MQRSRVFQFLEKSHYECILKVYNAEINCKLSSIQQLNFLSTVQAMGIAALTRVTFELARVREIGMTRRRFRPGILHDRHQILQTTEGFSFTYAFILTYIELASSFTIYFMSLGVA